MFVYCVYWAKELVQVLTCLARFAVEKSLLQLGQLLLTPLGAVLGAGWDMETGFETTLWFLV